MRFHSQNLNDLPNATGSMFWHGRAWFHLFNHKFPTEDFHIEWIFGKRANGMAATLEFGYRDDCRGICAHVCIPWIFSVFIVISGIVEVEKSVKTGFAIHSGAFWIYPFVYSMETNSKDPWYRHCITFNFPWTLDWHSTEILDGRGVLSPKNDLCRVVWRDDKKHRKPFLSEYDERNRIEQSVTEIHPFTYKLKNGDVQHRTASIHCCRMEWRARWWPLIRIKKIRTYIDVKFNKEVGERSGSWKGGCVGCSEELKPMETMRECLKRMQEERKFN